MAEKEYIERDKINNYISELRDHISVNVGLSEAEFSFISDVMVALDNFTAADVAPVKHAKWAYGKLHGQSGYYCSECGAGFADINLNAELIAKSHDYCPKCGAKMDE